MSNVLYIFSCIRVAAESKGNNWNVQSVNVESGLISTSSSAKAYIVLAILTMTTTITTSTTVNIINVDLCVLERTHSSDHGIFYFHFNLSARTRLFYFIYAVRSAKIKGF